MLPFYQSNLLNHFKVVSEWVKLNGAVASISIPGCVLQVQHKNRVIDFQPQFRSLAPDGAPTVWFEIQPKSNGFFGWLPYFNKVWPIARSKWAFKEFARDQRINTPRFGRDPTEFNSFLVKSNSSSFGEGITGPHQSITADATNIELHENQFIEEFIEGDILKVFYWNERPVAVERYSPATVVGDGHSTIAELITTRPKYSSRPISLDIATALVKLKGQTLEGIPVAGESVVVDYRYGSALFNLVFKNTNCIRSIDSALSDQLFRVGELLSRAIPDPIRRNTVSSVDGVVDSNGTVWFLEMNCNPHLHPDVYPHMLDALFGADELFSDDLKPLHLRKRAVGR